MALSTISSRVVTLVMQLHLHLDTNDQMVWLPSFFDNVCLGGASAKEEFFDIGSHGLV